MDLHNFGALVWVNLQRNSPSAFQFRRDQISFKWRRQHDPFRRLSHKNSTIRKWSSSAFCSNIRGNDGAFMGRDFWPKQRSTTRSSRCDVMAPASLPSSALRRTRGSRQRPHLRRHSWSTVGARGFLDGFDPWPLCRLSQQSRVILGLMIFFSLSSSNFFRVRDELRPRLFGVQSTRALSNPGVWVAGLLKSKAETPTTHLPDSVG